MQLRPTPKRSPVPVLGALVAALAILCGSASGGAPEYPATLYLSGAASSLVPTSFQLLGAPGPSTPGTPSVSLVGGGSLTGTYNYIVVAGGSSGPDTASAISTSAVAASQNITVGNLPSGTAVDIYRQKSSQAGSSPFYYVGNTGSGATTYLDSLSDALAAQNRVLPEASNRIATTFSSTCAATTCGYLDFSPGVEPAPGSSTNLTPPTLTVSPSATPNNKGWIVDGAGSVTFPAGPWTFQVRTKTNNSNGVAHLVVGVWKVTTSGGVIATATPILAPNCTGVGTPAGCPGNAENTATNLVTAAATVQTVAHTVNLPLISLAAGEHLYVQFWRRQTTSYNLGGGANRLVTMMAYDNNNQITHPAASTLPNVPTLVTPADGAATGSSALAANFSDPDAGDTGTVDFSVCSAPALAGAQCAPLVANGSGSSPTVANGANGSWTAGPLADGTYYWQTRATDATGGQSSWTATRSFTLDTTLPVTTITAKPASITNATSANLSFGSSEAGTSFQCRLDGGAPAACTSPVGYTGRSEGTHTFRVDATDLAGNTSFASYSWTVDTTPPVTTITDGPYNATSETDPRLIFGSSEGGSTFECQLDGGAYVGCSSPFGYSGLGEGDHTFHVRATDAAGNTDPSPPASSWTVDTTPPETTINATGASFTLGSSEDGSSFQCQLDDGDPAPCSSPVVYSGLGEGGHTLRVVATDAAGNSDPTPAVADWTVDTTPPGAPTSFAGTVGPNSLTLSWTAPADGPIAYYVLYVNGQSTGRLDGKATTVKLGGFGSDDTRNFALAAVDAAGNEGPRTVALAGVPDLVGLRLSEAAAALEARGLVIGKQTQNAPATGALVVAQRPIPATLAPLQSTVFVTLADASSRSGSDPGSSASAPLAVHIAGAQNVSCTRSSRLTLQIQLDRKANLAVRFLTAGGVPVDSTRFVTVAAGSQALKLRLPTGLSKQGRYRVVVTASIGGQIVRAEIKLTIVRAGLRTTASSRACA
jgi:hypothetical protein